MADRPLVMTPGSKSVHYHRIGVFAACGWLRTPVAVESVPEGCRMCKRCTRRDGLSLECGCDISGAMLRRDGVTAYCTRCELDVKLIRETADASP